MLRSSVIVTIISIVSYSASFINQILIAKLFGASSGLDVYLVAISPPFLLMTITGSIISIALVPVLVKKKHQRGYAQFSGLLFSAVSLFTIASSGIAYVLSPMIINIMVPLFPEGQALQAVAMMRLALLIYVSSVMVSFFVALHNVSMKFFVAASVSILPYLGMIVFLHYYSNQCGTEALIWGMLAGNLLAIPLLLVGIKDEIRIDLGILSSYSEIKDLFRGMPVIFLSMFGVSSHAIIDAIWASRIGANHLSYLAYSQRIMFAVGTAIVLGPMTVLLPHLSEDIALSRHKEFRINTLRALRMLVVFLSMAGVIISVLAVPTVKLLFERGAFDRASTLQVGALLPWVFIGVFGMVCTILLFRAYYAKGDIVGTAMMGIVGAVLYFTLSGFLSNIKDLQGIVLAYAITWWTLLVWALMRLWRNNLYELLNTNNLRFLWQLALTLGICGGLVSFGNIFFIQSAINADVVFLGLRLLLLASLGLVLFLAVAVYVFKMSEVIRVLELFPLARVNNRLT